MRLHAGGLAIRRLRPEDFEAVLALLRQLPGSRASRSREGFARVFQALLDGEGQEAFVATLRQWIVGFVSLYYLDVLHHGGRVASIQELVVTAELRGRGIGRALIEFARARAKERHCTGTELALGLSGLEGRFATPGGFWCWASESCRKEEHRCLDPRTTSILPVPVWRISSRAWSTSGRP